MIKTKGIVEYDFNINIIIYDDRHWDHKTNAWKVYE